jgi:hypothetical protein
VKDLTKLSDEALAEEWEKHSQAALEAKDRARACRRESDRRRADREAKEKVAAMSDAERAALAQHLNVAGTTTEEEAS